MKQHIKSIAIKTPCYQSWDAMKNSANGRFCNNCNKEVVDFSALTSSQILEYLAGKKTTCGKFANNQLDALNSHLAIQHSPHFLRRYLSVAAGLLSLVPFVSAQAQSKPLIENHPYAHKRNSSQHKKINSLIAKSYLPADIAVSPPIATPDIKVQADADILVERTIGGVSVSYSFPRRLWSSIKWKIKSIFGN